MWVFDDSKVVILIWTKNAQVKKIQRAKLAIKAKLQTLLDEAQLEGLKN